MKELKTYQISLTFAGCFLGAGFISGQEIWQFFASFGYMGIAGLFLALTLMFLFGIILFELVHITGINEMDKIVLGFRSPVLERLAAFLQCGVLIGITIVMIAGIGALFWETLGLPSWAVSLLACVVCAFIVFYGLSGLLSVFSVGVPMIVTVTVIFALFMLRNGLPSMPEIPTGKTPLLPNWWVSAVTYAALNSFGSIGILTPFGAHVGSIKKMHRGVFGGVILLGAVALSVITLMLSLDSPQNAQMPTLTVANGFSSVLGMVFAVLLSVGMFSCALSSLVALDHFLCTHFVFVKQHRVPSIILTTLFAFICSFVGFSSLISLVYPLLGYMGMIFLILLVAHYSRAKRGLQNHERGNIYENQTFSR